MASSATAPLPPAVASVPETDFEAQIAVNNQVIAHLTTRHEDVDNLNVQLASSFLSRIISNMFLEARRPVDKQLISMQNCVAILSNKPQLHETLKLARAEGNYNKVAESPLIPPFLSSTIRSYLDSLRPSMEKLVRQDKMLKHWSPPTKLNLDKETLQHIESLELCYPSSRDRDFNIILHGLGSFKDDPVLKDRTSRIFTPQNKFLVNSSGTGKTRLLYEGLCQNWGLYFTAAVDSGFLGTPDMQTTIKNQFEMNRDFHQYPSLDRTIVDIPKAMQQNSERVSRFFSPILLARLLIFHLFLEIASQFGLTEDHKKRWLLLQLNPDSLSPLGPLAFGLGALEQLPTMLTKENTTYIQEDIADVLRKIRRLLGDDEHLFIVVDEAQVAAKKFDKAFATGKPLLTEIMRLWGSHTTKYQSFIYAGTDIPKTLFEGVDGEGSDYEWCSGTGAFETAEAQNRYISSFLPLGFSTSPTGSFLIARMSNWLLGRYRSTASFVHGLLREGFKTPHTRFNAYIRASTGFEPLDAMEEVEAEGRGHDTSWEVGYHRLDFSSLPTDVKHMFLDILFHFMATHRASLRFGPEQIDLVGKGYARCVDAGLSVIAVDEPLFVVAAARSLFPHPSSRPFVEEDDAPDHPNQYPGTFVGSLRLNTPRTPQALSHCLVFYLAHVFSEPRSLCDVFKFPHKTPTWAKQSAQLARFHRNESLEIEHSVGLSTDASSPLATGTSSLEETISWLDHQYGTSFCLPSSSDPNLLFALQLTDKSFIWVALRALPSDEPIPDSELKTALSGLEPKCLFDDKGDDASLHSRALDALEALPGRSSKLGKYSLLRVVSSFTAEVGLETCVNKRSRDVASLSLAALEGTEAEPTQPEFFDSIVAGVLAGQKRKAARDDASSETRPKRQRSADLPAADSPGRAADSPAALSDSPEHDEPAAPTKKRAGKLRAQKQPSVETPVSHNTRSKTKTEGKAQA